MKFRKKPVVIEAERVPMPNQFVEHGLLLGMFYRSNFQDFMVTPDEGMTCPKGCLRVPDHPGFHTTSPAIAEKEDKPQPFTPIFIESLNLGPDEAILGYGPDNYVRIINLGKP